MLNLALIGCDIKASKSHQIMAFLGQNLGVKLSYSLVELNKNSTAQQIFSAAENFDGVNITMPFKTVAAEALGDRQGSVNTLKHGKNGQFLGFSTDGGGVLDALEYHNINLANKDVLVLGAGGAARSAAFALAELGARLEIRNRTQSRADVLFAACGARPATEPFDAILSFLPVYDKIFGVGVLELVRSRVVFDANYKAPTELLDTAQSCGVLAINGLPMLFFQAVRAFSIFAGIKIEKKQAFKLFKNYLSGVEND